MLTLTPTSWTVIATRLRTDEKYEWLEVLDAPYTLSVANRLAADGKLIKALRYTAESVEVVVRHAANQPKPAPKEIDPLSASKVCPPQHPRKRRRRSARDFPTPVAA